MLSFVAFDLRTPLFAISLTGRSLEKSLAGQVLGADSQRILKSLRRNVQQLQDLIGKVLGEGTNLLEVIGVKVEVRWFDLWPLVEALLDDLGNDSGRGEYRAIESRPCRSGGVCRRRAAQEGVQEPDRQYHSGFRRGGEVIVGAQATVAQGIVECWVSDNGQGVAAELLEKVFDKGESVGEGGSASGLGLGLAIVKSFIEAHDGSISLQSVLGQGSKFCFAIPVRTGPDA